MNDKTKQEIPEALVLAENLTRLATAAVEPTVVGNYQHVVVPNGYKVEGISEQIEKRQPAPNRKHGTVQLKDLDSLMLYMEDQAAAASAYVYADSENRKITAVFNDQRANEGWRDHRAEFKAEFTPEFKKWAEKDRDQFTQTEFAEFIEDNMADITEPAAGALLEMATTIQAKTDINFSSAKRLQNGQVQLQYTENIDARAGANGAMEIPKEFALGLRIFKNGDGYKLKARLKYRLHSGNIKFFFELDRVERSIEDAFSAYVTKLKEASSYRVLLGTP